MAEFKRSRLVKKNEDEITKKTVVLGLLTIVIFVLLIVFGLPMLIKLSVILGEARSKNDVVKEKVLPPPSPRLVIPFEATNSAQVKISGYSEKGLTVELLKNDVSLGKTQVSDTGDFSFDNITLDNGDNTFQAVSIDAKGGSSEPSKQVTIAYDTKAPQITMINPTEDSLTVDYADFDVTGKTEAGVSVTINNRVAMVDDTGRFKLKFQLNPGDNNLVILAQDIAGNQTTKNIKITYDH